MLPSRGATRFRAYWPTQPRVRSDRHFSNSPATFIRMPIVGIFHTSEPQVGHIRDCVNDAPPKVEVSSPHGEPTVRVRHGDDKNCSGKERKGLKIVSQCSFGPSGNAGERRDALFPRAGSPPIASLPALQMRHDDDVHDAEDYTCGEQGEFGGHIREHTNSTLQTENQPLDSEHRRVLMFKAVRRTNSRNEFA